jgi:TRAP-type C4-dicarboxylate transport system permease small subunit
MATGWTMQGARSLLDRLFRTEAAIASTAFAVITAAVFFDLVGREFFGKGLYGAQRVAVYCMVWAAMLGFALAVAWGAHLRIGGIERLVPKAWNAATDRIADLASCGACLFLAYWSYVFVAVAYEQKARGMAFDFPLWPIQAVILWCFASGALRYLLYAVFPTLRPREAPEAEEL